MAGVVKEDQKKLDVEAKLQEGARTLTAFILAVEKLLAQRGGTLFFLKKLKADTEVSYEKHSKAKVGGAVGSIVGVGLMITGFALSLSLLEQALG